MDENIYTTGLLSILPANLRQCEEIQAAAQAVDAECRQIAEKEIRQCLLLPRLDELPPQILDLLAWQWHVDFYDGTFSPERKRNLIRRSIAWHRIKGTPAAVEEVVKAAYGNCVLTEWFEYGGEPYFFKVAVTLEEESTDKSRWKNVIAAISSAKNTRSWLEDILFYYPPIYLPVRIKHISGVMQTIETLHNAWNLGGARAARWDGEFNLGGVIRLEGIVPGEGYKERQSHRAGIWFSVDAVQHNYALTNILDGAFCWDGGHNLSGARMKRLPILRAGLDMTADVRQHKSIFQSSGVHIHVGAKQQAAARLHGEIFADVESRQKKESRQQVSVAATVGIKQAAKAVMQAQAGAGIEAKQKIKLAGISASGQTIESRHTNDHRMWNTWDGGFCLDGSHTLDGAQVLDKRIKHCCTVETNGRMENI